MNQLKSHFQHKQFLFILIAMLLVLANEIFVVTVRYTSDYYNSVLYPSYMLINGFTGIILCVIRLSHK